MALSNCDFFFAELAAAVNMRWWRWFTVWFRGGMWVNVSYRMDRFLFLLLGKPYVLLRPVFSPVYLLFAFLGDDMKLATELILAEV